MMQFAHIDAANLHTRDTPVQYLDWSDPQKTHLHRLWG